MSEETGKVDEVTSNPPIEPHREEDMFISGSRDNKGAPSEEGDISREGHIDGGALEEGGTSTAELSLVRGKSIAAPVHQVGPVMK